MKNLLLLVAAISLMGTACTWVKVEEDAQDIVVGTEANVRGCERLSETNVQVADKVGPVNRSRDKVAQELLNLGRNEALRMGADTIVPTSEPNEGRQSFAMYRCQ